jgi:RNA recognition motif-containing protein
MNSSTGSTSNINSTSTIAPRGGPTSSTAPPSTSQQPNTVRAPVKAPLTTANRPNSNSQSGQQQQQRNNGNYYQQNNRGNYWNDNSQQDHNSARRSGANVGTPPNGHQVFVGSLPSDFKKETLIEFFGKFGTVLDAKIHTPNNEHKKVCFYCCFN